MRLNRRQFYTATTATAAAVAAGGSWWILRDEEFDSEVPRDLDSGPRLERLDLLAGAYADEPQLSDPEMLVMLSLSGGEATNTRFELRFFGLDGIGLEDIEEPAVTLANLITGEETSDFTFTWASNAWKFEQSMIESNGWWQLRVERGDLSSSWTFHNPDPNILGSAAMPEIETDPDAQAMLAGALNVLSNHSSLRWWQWLSSGAAAIVLSRFSVTTPESNGLPPSFQSDSILSGRIPLSPLDGQRKFSEENPRTVTIGNEARRYSSAASPETMNPVQYLPIDQYHTTYDGYDQVHFGMTAEIDGRECQLVAFHLWSGFSTWFAFWIEIDTLVIRKLFMVTMMHYMHWVYYDIDEPFELTF